MNCSQCRKGHIQFDCVNSNCGPTIGCPPQRSNNPTQAAHIFTQQSMNEWGTACTKHPRFHSFHEGYAVLAEEVDELWDIVRQKDDDRDLDTAYAECVQIAAMAMRFATELCGE